MEDALGRRTTTEYDALNRPEVERDPLNYRVTTRYDRVGNALSVEDALGYRHTTHYDRLRRAIADEDTRGNRTTRYYDQVGRVTLEEDALGRRTSSNYDVLDRELDRRGPDGQRWTQVRDAAGNRRESGFRRSGQGAQPGALGTAVNATSGRVQAGIAAAVEERAPWLQAGVKGAHKAWEELVRLLAGAAGRVQAWIARLTARLRFTLNRHPVRHARGRRKPPVPTPGTLSPAWIINNLEGTTDIANEVSADIRSGDIRVHILEE